jgi:excisionase family DNA binding protein
MLGAMAEDEIRWMSTGEAAKRLGVTVRTLYRLIDESQLPAYKFGRVIRLQESQVDAFIEASRIPPGSLEHLYPDVKREMSESD